MCPSKSATRRTSILNVTYVKNDDMITESQVLAVPARDRMLKLDVIPNKKEYKPRDVASYTILARNADGSPAAGAEVSLGIVDEAIYSIQPETAPQHQARVLWQTL